MNISKVVGHYFEHVCGSHESFHIVRILPDGLPCSACTSVLLMGKAQLFTTKPHDERERERESGCTHKPIK